MNKYRTIFAYCSVNSILPPNFGYRRIAPPTAVLPCSFLILCICHIVALFCDRAAKPCVALKSFLWGSSAEKQCLSCHVKTGLTAVHSIHTFGKCVGCHMPLIAKSAESRDIHSHVFVTLLPNPDKPERIATKALRHKEYLFIII